MTAEIVIALATPTRAHGGGRVLQVARWLVRQGVTIEFVAMGESTEAETAEFSAVAPVTVVDRFRRQGASTVPHLLGQRTLTAGMKRTRLRRWLSGRKTATFLLYDPLTASLLRYAPERPARVIAALPDSSWTLDRARPEDLDTLADTDGWIVSSDAQVAEVRSRFDRSVVRFGPAEGVTTLIDRAELPAVSAAGPGTGVVVLLSPIGLWDAVDHAIEIAWRLHRTMPTLGLRWIVDTEDDRWLARHDLEHAGLTGVVEIAPSSDPGALADVAVVVRTGYTAAHEELALAAALASVPVEGLCVSDLSPEAPRRAAFDLDSLTDDLLRLIDDPAERATRGVALRAQLARVDLEDHIGDVASLLAIDRR